MKCFCHSREPSVIPAKPRPGCPRRLSRPRPGLTIRREQTRDGYSLHFTGRDASSWLMDDVFGDIERMYGVG